jgi:hypothetical protein
VSTDLASTEEGVAGTSFLHLWAGIGDTNGPRIERRPVAGARHSWLDGTKELVRGMLAATSHV